MTPRALRILPAILAALVWAPSTVLAAPPNQLLSPTASPPGGTTATHFSLSVRYVTQQGNAAGSVTAEVAGRQLAMALSSGSAHDGRWTVTTRLPAGSWTVTFSADAARGPDPKLDGPTLRVATAASATFTPPAVKTTTPAPTLPAGSPSLVVVGDEGDVQTATPPARVVASQPPPVTALPPATPAPAPGGGAVPLPEAASVAAAPASSAPATTSTVAAPASPDPVAAGATTPPSQAIAEPPANGNLLVMLAVLVSLATLALLGTGWLLTGAERRRREDGEQPAEEMIDAVALRRSRRRRIQAAPDPILASMGLDEEQDPAAPERGRARGASTRRRPGRRG